MFLIHSWEMFDIACLRVFEVALQSACFLGNTMDDDDDDGDFLLACIGLAFTSCLSVPALHILCRGIRVSLQSLLASWDEVSCLSSLKIIVSFCIGAVDGMRSATCFPRGSYQNCSN